MPRKLPKGPCEAPLVIPAYGRDLELTPDVLRLVRSGAPVAIAVSGGKDIANGSAGYTFTAGGRVVQPQIYVDNIFDNKYLLKGAFFSGASVGRPRTIQVRLNVGI
jgi:hypothetical protein